MKPDPEDASRTPANVDQWEEMMNLAAHSLSAGNSFNSQQAALELVEIGDRIFIGSDRRKVEGLVMLGEAYYGNRRHALAEDAYRRAIAVAREIHGAGSELEADLLCSIGTINIDGQEFAGARDALRAALDIRSASRADSEVRFVTTGLALVSAHYKLNESLAIGKLLTELWPKMAALETSQKRGIAEKIAGAGEVLFDSGMQKEAEIFYREALAVLSEGSSEAASQSRKGLYMDVSLKLALTLSALDRKHDAVTIVNNFIEAEEALPPTMRQRLPRLREHLAYIFEDHGDAESIFELRQSALHEVENSSVATPIELVSALIAAALACENSMRFMKAVELLDRAQSVIPSKNSAEQAELYKHHGRLAETFLRPDAEDLENRERVLRERLVNDPGTSSRSGARALGSCYLEIARRRAQNEDFDDAAEYVEKAWDYMSSSFPEDYEEYEARCKIVQSICSAGRGDVERALLEIEEVIGIYTAVPHAHDPKVLLEPLALKSEYLSALDRDGEALEALESCYGVMRARNSSRNPDCARVQFRLALLIEDENPKRAEGLRISANQILRRAESLNDGFDFTSFCDDR